MTEHIDHIKASPATSPATSPSTLPPASPATAQVKQQVRQEVKQPVEPHVEPPYPHTSHAWERGSTTRPIASRAADRLLHRFTTSLRIGLSPNAIDVVRTRGWLYATRDVLGQSQPAFATPDEAMSDLRSMLDDAGVTGLPVTVILGNEWGRLFMVVPPRNAESQRDCEAAAHLRFQQLYGESPSEWTMRADWHAHHPFLACAMPTSLLEGLRRACADHRLSLLGVRPQFVAAWNRWCRTLRDGDWFGTVDAQALTLGLRGRGHLTEIRRVPLTDAARADAAWPALQAGREALRQAIPAPRRLCLSGAVPAAWLAEGSGCVRMDGDHSGLLALTGLAAPAKITE